MNIREELCDNCLNGIELNEYNEIHQICKTGKCVLCFQAGSIDCDDFEQINKPLSELLRCYGNDNVYHDLDVNLNTIGYVTNNPEGSIFKYRFIAVF